MSPAPRVPQDRPAAPPVRTVEVLPDAAAVARLAAERFAALARDAVRLRRAFRVALAGGSTPRALYSLLGGPLGEDVPWRDVHVFWGDERCVPPDHAESNFRMVGETLLSSRTLPPGNVHRVQGELPDPARAAALYEEELRRAFGLVAGELPRFDLVLLGMGADGHCASLFPGSSALDAGERLVVATRVERLGADRVTLALPVLCAAAHVAFVVTGGEKAAMLARVLADEPGRRERPAGLVRPVRGTLAFLVDRAAAEGLAR